MLTLDLKGARQASAKPLFSFYLMCSLGIRYNLWISQFFQNLQIFIAGFNSVFGQVQYSPRVSGYRIGALPRAS